MAYANSHANRSEKTLAAQPAKNNVSRRCSWRRCECAPNKSSGPSSDGSLDWSRRNDRREVESNEGGSGRCKPCDDAVSACGVVVGGRAASAVVGTWAPHLHASVECAVWAFACVGSERAPDDERKHYRDQDMRDVIPNEPVRTLHSALPFRYLARF